MSKVKTFFKRKDIEVSLKRYGIDALGAMAQGLFCTLLVGTILDTIGKQFGIGFPDELLYIIPAGQGQRRGQLPVHRVLHDHVQHRAAAVHHGEQLPLGIRAAVVTGDGAAQARLAFRCSYTVNLLNQYNNSWYSIHQSFPKEKRKIPYQR